MNPSYAAIGLAMLPFALAGCGSPTPEDARARTIERCERQFGQMAPDPALGNALCTCMYNDLEEEGLEITDMLGPDRARVEEISRRCASRVGVPLPA